MITFSGRMTLVADSAGGMFLSAEFCKMAKFHAFVALDHAEVVGNFINTHNLIISCFDD